MSDRPTQRQMEQARLAGMSARQNGRGIGSAPLYAMGEFGRILAEAWRAGWEREDASRKAGR